MIQKKHFQKVSTMKLNCSKSSNSKSNSIYKKFNMIFQIRGGLLSKNKITISLIFKAYMKYLI